MLAIRRNFSISMSGVGDRSRGGVYPRPQRCPWEPQDGMHILYCIQDDALTVIQSNILVDADGRVHVAGLGATSIPPTALRVAVDTFFHGAAPELIDPRRFRLTNAGATAATDVYAFGVLAFEVSERRPRFPHSQIK